ncbi:TetR/AcrR family transcriptional regulator [Roseibium sp. RKSG952]|uniref:TetR/AcrR family transcriptional regulator n=1 Tax=Roseibium sp. RKSG952 TaxID=2529384 RepID=UPI0012BCC08C|nr:TetR/AcrR family transcriptional regulator [Roseibium sp. RKSG952]MTH98157.1 TetR/AcrR family transcriptional regulator [Roseibium sp. RKSG952]
MATAKARQKIVKTFLELIADQGFDPVTMPQVAEAAGVKMSALRESFGSKSALVAAFAEQIDCIVLDERDDDMADQPSRDRLFDILMTRIDHLAPHREAVRALYKAAKHDPVLALEFNRIAVRSQQWMLTAAGIELHGLKKRIVAQGVARAYANVLETWLDEADEGMPKTMARLDKELDDGVGWMKRLNRLEGVLKMAGRLRSRSRCRKARRRRDQTDADRSGETVRPDEGEASAAT